MMLQMLGVFAELEHATIVDRVTAGLERRVREGRWMGRRIPYGYTRDPRQQSALAMPGQGARTQAHLRALHAGKTEHRLDRAHP
jgi:DNA invertase Pin-like site-specific DNA recombinase